MNKMAYYYCDVPLGILEKTEKGYAYTSNIDNEQKLRDNIAVRANYELWGSFKRESRGLFPEMEMLLKKFSRQDIQERAKIKPEDSVWEKLVKISQLNVYPAGFYVRTLDEAEIKIYRAYPKKPFFLKIKNPL